MLLQQPVTATALRMMVYLRVYVVYTVIAVFQGFLPWQGGPGDRQTQHCIMMVYCLQIVMGQVLYATMQHKVAAVGDSVLLACHTNLSHSVDWSFMKTEDSWHERQIIFENNVTHENYIKNIRIRPEIDWLHGDYNMKIYNATLNDSGFYICIEDGSLGDKHAINLTVAETVVFRPSEPTPFISSLAVVVSIVVITLFIFTVVMITYLFRSKFAVISLVKAKPKPKTDADEVQMSLLPERGVPQKLETKIDMEVTTRLDNNGDNDSSEQESKTAEAINQDPHDGPSPVSTSLESEDTKTTVAVAAAAASLAMQSSQDEVTGTSDLPESYIHSTVAAAEAAGSESTVGTSDAAVNTLRDEPVRATGRKEELNWLFIGDSGVGKSTAINAFVQYLRYSALAEAEKHALELVIQSTVTVTDPFSMKSRDCSTGDDSNENYDGRANSVTQFPKIHTIDYDRMVIRIVDTPGLNDTRGREQDKKNLEYTLAQLAELRKLDAIVILLNPKINRMTSSFKFLLSSILSKLHGRAKDNIIFLVTNAVTCKFRSSETTLMLKQYLNESNLNSIKVTTDTVYYVDNEAIPYLIKFKSGIQHLNEDRCSAEKSWKKSTDQIIRMLTYTLSLTPIEVDAITALNKARETIEHVTGPLLQISSCIGRNAWEMQAKSHEIQQKYDAIENAAADTLRETLRDLMSHLKTTTYVVKTRPADHWRLICNKCCETNRNGVVLPVTCQEYVTVAFVTQLCQVMNRGVCQKCNCSHHCHEMVKYSCHVKEKETLDEVVLAKLLFFVKSPSIDRTEAAKLVEKELKELKLKSEDYRKEQEIIIRNIAKLRVLLIDNSLVGENQIEDRVVDHFKRAIKAIDGLASDEGRAIRDSLEKLQNDYTSVLVEERLLCHSLKLTTVMQIVETLCLLPHCGPQLKEAIDQIEETNKAGQQSGTLLTLLPTASSIGNFLTRYFRGGSN